MEVLGKLHAERTTVSVQIEGSPTRFKSRLLLKDDQVVFAKPSGGILPLTAGSLVRFRIPEEPQHEMRLEVFAPHVNLASGSAVFLCKIPTSGLATSKRQEDRLGVAHLSNVMLVMPSRAREFRLADISPSGCRVTASLGEAKVYFPLGRELSQMYVQVGSKAKVELDAITPRSYGKSWVGCEFKVKEEGTSQVYLARLIEALEQR
jgi:hypothetical protein